MARCEECDKWIPDSHYLCKYHWIKEQRAMQEKEKRKDFDMETIKFQKG